MNGFQFDVERLLGRAGDAESRNEALVGGEPGAHRLPDLIEGLGEDAVDDGGSRL